MVERNPDLGRIKDNYLFVEIARRKRELLAKNPHADVISLGIGDTTEPIPELIIDAFVEAAKKLGSHKTYTGYGDPPGLPLLRERIAEKIYKNRIGVEDVFISDGAKSDLGRLQFLFGKGCSLSIQDPAYPVYAGASVMSGKDRIAYMPCLPDNGFCPDWETLPCSDLIYICSPNNPTGATLTHEQLTNLVNVARKRESLIIFDAAYAGFIQDPSLPRSIYEIEGAKEVAIEIGSFSKLAGFTGVRLGWTIVPKELLFNDGSSVQKDWLKVVSTTFNEASVLAQAGGIALVTDEGLFHAQKLCDYYMENAKILRGAIESIGYHCFGGENAPYLWVDIKGEDSWEFFDHILQRAHLVTTPGAGFGPAGIGFLRLSAFGKRETIVKATARLQQLFSKV